MSRPTVPTASRSWPPATGLAVSALLIVSTLLTVAVGLRHHPGLGWGYTQTGTVALDAGGPAGGLHLYTDHPELQIGPLTFVLGLVVLALPAAARSPALWLAMSAAGPLLVGGVAVLARTSRGATIRPAALLTGGVAVLAAWSVLAIPGGHLEDVLALASGILAVAARRSHRLDLAALAVAGAVDVKPWAVAFAALLLDPDATVRAQVRATVVAAAGIVAVWAPFLVGDRSVLRLLDFTIPNAADSTLRVLGYRGAATPAWDRPAELVLGLALGAVLSWRRRPEGVLLAGLVARTLLDPGTHAYYTAGLLLVALLFDACVAGWTLPWTTLAGLLLVYLPHVLLGAAGFATLRGSLRLVFGVATVAVLVLAASGRSANRRGAESG